MERFIWRLLLNNCMGFFTFVILALGSAIAKDINWGLNLVELTSCEWVLVNLSLSAVVNIWFNYRKS